MPRKNMKKGGENMPEPEAFSPMAGVVAETPAPVMEGGKKKRVYKKKGGEDSLSSLALLGLQKGMVGAGEHEMEGGKKKRVYKKKGGKDAEEVAPTAASRASDRLVEIAKDIPRTSYYNMGDSLRSAINNNLNFNNIDKGVTPLWMASRENRPEIVRLLIKAGADVEKGKEEDDETPLLVASKEGHLEIVKLLVEAGADMDKKDEYGRTVLDVAVAYSRPHRNTNMMQEYLKKKGARTSEDDSEMGGGKKKRVYKKKGGEDTPVMEGGKKKRVYKKKGGAVSQVAGQLKKLSDEIAKIMKF